MSILETTAWKSCEEELRERYSSDGRFYHTAAHVEDCLSKLESTSRCENREALKIAIWFHDAIYDSLRTDNEEASAKLAVKWLKSISAPSHFQTVVFDLIIATNHKTQPNTDDELLIVDIDLSILGSTEEFYDLYAKNIRKEYANFSDDEYINGRTKVLRHFLDQPQLFKSEEFRNHYEFPANRNLKRELKSLS